MNGHSAVWTGREMVVWGGVTASGAATATGGRYDPASDTWRATSVTAAPSARVGHRAVWTGSAMIVWGGADTNQYTTNTGGRYDPIANSWSPTSTSGAPSPRSSFTAVWTGSEMVVWGGGDEYQTGGRYNPALDSWVATSLVNAPTGRCQHGAVWTGTEMVVWGGYQNDSGDSFNDGARYNTGTGAWTHQYGDAGNSANGQEDLQGVTSTDRLAVQWLGRPGGDFGLDRNPRMPAPLAIHGRLFHQGMNRIAALDSYNGTVLWSLEIPALRRVNMPRDAGNWCADPHHLYVAIKDRCWVISAQTGEVIRTLSLADAGLRATHEWGYVAQAGKFLYGSSVRKGAPYTDFWGGKSWYDATSGAGTEKVCSDDLFALAGTSGELKWRYRGGVILNTTIAVAGGMQLLGLLVIRQIVRIRV